MKKIILGIAVASLFVGCKKVPQGGNKDVIKVKDGVERYTDQIHQEGTVEKSSSAAHHTEKVSIDLNGTQLKGAANGMESQMIQFLSSGGYDNAANDDALKQTWYNFDNVTFKMGSSNQLEAGSEEQLDNLSKILKAYPNAKIKIGGYTDKTGNEATNLKISKERAEFIKSQLTKLGVGNQVVSAEGFGSQFAKIPASASDQERATDRKMAVRFTK